MKYRWVAAKYKSDFFVKNNEKWLSGMFELCLKSFGKFSERSKRLKIVNIRLSDSPKKIIYAAQMKLKAQRNRRAANVLIEISKNMVLRSTKSQ